MMKLILHDILSGEFTPIPEGSRIRLAADGFFIEVSLDNNGLCLRSGGSDVGAGCMRIRPLCSNCIIVTTNADVEREISEGAKRLIDVEKRNRAFARKSGYGKKPAKGKP